LGPQRLYLTTLLAVTAMNYRHAYHAGNFADVLKHTVLLALIEAMQSKPTPFCVIETHAGSGCYALDSREAGKTGEFKDGISRLLYPDLHGSTAKASSLPPLLRRWLDSILAVPGNEEGLKVYPGSPLQAANAMRAEDSAQLSELHPEEATLLHELFRRDPRIHVHQRDGYEALSGLLPPKEKRGLVLIDPPYEAQEAEYKRIEQAIKASMQRWPTGVYAIWYPIKLRSQVQPFLRWMSRCGAKRVLRAELMVHPDDSPLRLNGSGMVILNAPWKLDDTLREPLQAMARLLSKDRPAEWKLDWLLQEGAEPPAPSPLPPSRLAALRLLSSRTPPPRASSSAPPSSRAPSSRAPSSRTPSLRKPSSDPTSSNPKSGSPSSRPPRKSGPGRPR
jgi:23S rRNA (adenine2030-N6)-methyltransferase